MRRPFLIWGGALMMFLGAAQAQIFNFPTANRALLQPGAEAQFFVGTAGRPWTSGQFGCVRSDGRQFHEGLDIRCLQPDRRGEPTDPVNASATGVVAYINSRPGLSNYGNYVVLRHSIEGMEVYTLYAHLSAIRKGLRVGDRVNAGENIAIMGRTANTHQAITKDRAHLHFEIDLVVNERYAAWHQSRMKETRNDHGNFNGRNLLGLDPQAILKLQAQQGARFSLVEYVRSLPVMARVAVRDTRFVWAKRYPQLLIRNPQAEREGVAGYELGLAFNGMPVQVIPRSASELKDVAKTKLLQVNEAEWSQHPCGKLIFKRGQVWTLLAHGGELLDLMTY